MARFAVGRCAGAGRDDGDRGRDRRAERDRDADRGRRPLRDLAAAPAARPDRPRRARVAVPAVRPHATRARLQALARESDGFELAEIDLELRGAGRAGRHAPVRFDAHTGSPSFPRDARAAGARAPLRRARDRRATPIWSEPEHALLADRRCATRYGAEARRRSAHDRACSDAGHRRQLTGGPRLEAPRGEQTRPTVRPRARGAVLDPRRSVDEARRCSICSPARARSGSRRSRAAPRAPRSSTRAPAAVAAMRAQPRALGLAGGVRADRRRCGRSLALPSPARQYDLVFLDPPYRLASDLGAGAVARAARGPGRRRPGWWRRATGARRSSSSCRCCASGATATP